MNIFRLNFFLLNGITTTITKLKTSAKFINLSGVFHDNQVGELHEK